MIRAVSTPELEISAKRLHARNRSRVSSAANSRRVSVRTDFELVDDSTLDQSASTVKRWSFTRKRRAKTPEMRRSRPAISASSATSFKSEQIRPRTTKSAQLRQQIAIEHKRAAEDPVAKNPGMKRPSPAPRRRSMDKAQSTSAQPNEGQGDDAYSRSLDERSNPDWRNAPIDKNALKLDFRGLHEDEDAPSASQYAPANPPMESPSPAAATISSGEGSMSKIQEDPNDSKESPAAALGNILQSTADLATGYQAGQPVADGSHGLYGEKNQEAPWFRDAQGGVDTQTKVSSPVQDIRGGQNATPLRKLAAYSKRSRSSKEGDREESLPYHQSEPIEKRSKPPTPPSATGSVASSKKLASYRRSRRESREEAIGVEKEAHNQSPVRREMFQKGKVAHESPAAREEGESEQKTEPGHRSGIQENREPHRMEDGLKEHNDKEPNSKGDIDGDHDFPNMKRRSHQSPKAEQRSAASGSNAAKPKSEDEPAEVTENCLLQHSNGQAGPAVSPGKDDKAVNVPTRQGSVEDHAKEKNDRALAAHETMAFEDKEPKRGSSRNDEARPDEGSPIGAAGEGMNSERKDGGPFRHSPKLPDPTKLVRAVIDGAHALDTRHGGPKERDADEDRKKANGQQLEIRKSDRSKKSKTESAGSLPHGQMTSKKDVGAVGPAAAGTNSTLDYPKGLAADSPKNAIWYDNADIQPSNQNHVHSGDNDRNGGRSNHPVTVAPGGIAFIAGSKPESVKTERSAKSEAQVPSHVNIQLTSRSENVPGPAANQNATSPPARQSSLKEPGHSASKHGAAQSAKSPANVEGRRYRGDPVSVRSVPKSQMKEGGEKKTSRSIAEEPGALTPDKLDTIRRYLEEQANVDQDRMSDVQDAIVLQQSNRSEKKRAMDPVYHLTLVIERITDEKRQLTELCSQLLQQMRLTTAKLIEIEARQEQSLLAFLPQDPYWKSADSQRKEDQTKSNSNAIRNPLLAAGESHGQCGKCEELERLHKERSDKLREEYEEQINSLTTQISELNKQLTAHQQAPKVENTDSFAQTDDLTTTHQNNEGLPEPTKPLENDRADTAEAPAVANPEEADGLPKDDPSKTDHDKTGDTKHEPDTATQRSPSKFSNRFQDLQNENSNLKKQLENLQHRCDALTKLIKLG